LPPKPQYGDPILSASETGGDIWRERLCAKAILVADGAWGTQLARRGLKPGEPPELWNAERPEAVEAVAHAYIAAGADIILTNTFGGNRFKLARSGLAARTTELNRLGVEISCRAAARQLRRRGGQQERGERQVLVFASIGPTGEFAAPLGTRTQEELTDAFREQIRACLAGGANGLVIETMTALDEALAALRAAREATTLPVVVSLTFTRGPKGLATIMGLRPEEAARELDAAGADIIGANCGTGSNDMVEIIRRLRSATNRPLWAKPNAGVPKLVRGRTIFPETPTEMAGRVRALIMAGANIIGGCCGTTPAHIRRIAAAAVRNRALARRSTAGMLSDSEIIS